MYNGTMKIDDAGLKQLLRTNGFRATPARLALLELLHKTQKPLSIQRIMQRLRSHHMDMATIYRSLNAFAEKDIVRCVELQHGHAHYELASTGHHHHMTCASCGEVEDLHGLHGGEIEQQALKQSTQFASVSDHVLEVFGLCKSCARKKRG